MKVVLTLALLACVAALTRACCTPDQWEGIQVSKAGYTKGWFHKGMITEYSTVSYDYTNKRSATTLSYRNGKIDAKLKTIIIFAKNESDVEGACGGSKIYRIDLKKNKCYEKHIPDVCEFRKLCIPAKAKSKEFYLGLEGVFKVNAFEFKKEWEVHHHKNSLVADITVTEVAKGVCAPVGEQLVGHMYGVDFIQNIAFINIKPGINDTSVFDVPKICEKSLDMDLLEDIPRTEQLTLAL